MRILAIAFTPIVALLSAVIAQILNLKLGVQPWAGEVLLSATWVWTSTFLCGPVLTTVAAWDGARLFPRNQGAVWSRSHVREPLIRRWWAISTAAAALPALMTLGWMATFFPAATSLAIIGSSIITVLAGVMTLAALLGAGLCLGSMLGKIYGPLAAFAVALIFQLISYLGSSPVFMVGGVSDSLLGLRLSWPAILLQIGGVLALLILEGSYLFARSWAGARLTPLSVGALAAALVILAAPGLVDVQRFVGITKTSYSYGCVALGPHSRPPGTGEVCISLEHQRKSPEVMQAWSRISTAASQAGITDFPTRLYELPPGAGPQDVPAGPPGSTVTYTLNAGHLDIEHGTVTASWLADTIVNPTWCPGVWREQPPGLDSLDVQTQTAQALHTLITPGISPAQRDAAATAFRDGWAKLQRCEGLR